MKPTLIAAIVCLIPTSHAQSKPNVIIVLTDDQGYGDLSVTGNPVVKTPNMDRLAHEGVQFTDFHVDSYCTPTRAALMTGRYAHRVGGWGTVNGRNMLRDDEVTMADVFRHNGYRTGHFGKWHLGTNYPYRPVDRGFDEWLGKGDGGTGCTTDYWGNDRVNDHYIHNGRWEENPRAGFEGDVFFDAALEFIRENKGQPFFTYLALYNPHNPRSLPDPKEAESYQGKNVNGDFFSTIARVDQNLGRLRQFLQEEGLTDNTLLVFLTDNGTAGGDRVFNAGMRGRKGSPYDGGHRVPCLLSWPAGGFRMPATVARLSAHLDLLPTLVDLCALNLPKPVEFDGVSLKPLLDNPRADWPERVLVMGAAANKAGPNAPPPEFGSNCAVMSERWRLVNDKELYDMTRDPGQRHDIANDNPEEVTQLRAAYQKYWADVSAHDHGWRGRPILGTKTAPDVELCAEDWFTTRGDCPWNQGAIANGAAASGHWPVRFAAAGNYRIEVRRWPRELQAAIAGVPTGSKAVDSWLDGRPVSGTLYKGTPRTLPVGRVELKIAGQVHTADVSDADTVKSFSVAVGAGPADIEATLLDKAGNALCGAYYVSVRKQQP
jgi:arylsulfatase A-like enzyme